jgi:hypothetical protein
MLRVISDVLDQSLMVEKVRRAARKMVARHHFVIERSVAFVQMYYT